MPSTSIIAQGTVVRGNIRGSGSIEIRGRVHGDVEVDGDVALGEQGGVEGNIRGAQLVIAGQVAGDLQGAEAVLLERGARVVGDLTAPRIGVAEGALVRGRVRTEGEPAAPRRAAVAAVRRVPEPVRLERPAPPPVAPAPVPTKAAAAAAPVAAAPAPASAERKKAPDTRSADRPPAPVVPALGKSVRGKKKKVSRA